MQDTLKLLPDFLITEDLLGAPDELFVLVQKLGIALLLGALIGLEREHARPRDEKIFAGIRTFPLISVFGFLSGLVSTITSVWIFLAAFLGFAGLLITSYTISAKTGRLGGTSEVSALISFFIGALVFWNLIILAAIIAVIITLLLSLKLQLHSFVGSISAEDLYATLKLAIITVIILPLLPDKTFDPLNVLNPRLIWYMVIFISGISFVGYILVKLYGKNKGIPLTGLMGGLVSSTAVTYALSRKSKNNPALSGNAAVGIILACMVMYPRVFFITLVINSSLISEIWIPLLILTVSGFAVSRVTAKKLAASSGEDIEIKNPFELKSGIVFGLLFGAVIFTAKAAQVYIGDAGIYIASGIAGITSVDAIVLSLSQLSIDIIKRKWLPLQC